MNRIRARSRMDARWQDKLIGSSVTSSYRDVYRLTCKPLQSVDRNLGRGACSANAPRTFALHPQFGVPQIICNYDYDHSSIVATTVDRQDHQGLEALRPQFC